MRKRELDRIVLVMSFLLVYYFVSATEYYCDPVNGSMLNNGSQISPWSSLRTVFQTGKIFNEGDVINLMNGHHGEVAITGNNSSHVIIQAAPDNHPTLKTLKISKASNWTIKNLVISPETAPGTYVRKSYIYTVENTSNHIILDNCELYSVDDITSWTASDWISNVCHAALVDGNNNKLINCVIRNIKTGMFINGDHNLIENNLIANFSEDGMRGLGDYNTFQYNRIQDNYKVNTNHDDGFQSYSLGPNWSVGASTVYGNVLRGNIIIQTTDPSRPLQGDLQGIGNFDGMFKDWIVENNIIICGSWHGISFLGAENCKILNNTVIDQNNNDALVPWIQITAHKDGKASSGNLIRNNLCTSLNNDDNVGIVDHNIVIDYSDYNKFFADFSNLDLHLKEACSAIDAGTAEEAPVIDASGNPRPLGIAVDVGANEYGVVCENNDSPSVPSNLRAVPDETSISLSWSASTHAPCYVAGYKIMRNGIEFANVYDTQYEDTLLIQETEYEYAIAAISGHGIPSEYSSTIKVKTLPDKTPPEIYIVPNTNIDTSVHIVFNEKVDKSSAESIPNYQIDNGIFVHSAQLKSDNRTVVLSVSQLQVGSDYTLTISNISDISGNAVTSPKSIGFSYFQASTILSVNKPVVVDSEYDEKYGAENAVDGDHSPIKEKRWLSAGSPYPHWIEIDLLKVYDVNEVKFWTGTVKYEHPVFDYQIQYWSSTEWVDIVNITSNSNAEVSHAFTPVNTDKIRLYCTKGRDDIIRLFELEVWGIETQNNETVSANNIEEENPHILVYPNPVTKEQFNMVLKGFNQTATVQISDMAGRKVYSALLISPNTPIQLTGLSLKGGVYILNASDGTTNKVCKFIVE